LRIFPPKGRESTQFHPKLTDPPHALLRVYVSSLDRLIYATTPVSGDNRPEHHALFN